jgi:arylsulfatase A-like enzyme
MHTRTTIPTFFAIALALVTRGSASYTADAATDRAAANKPNVLVMVADDLGYGDVSCLMRQVVATPNLDRLAAQGVKFTAGYATCPLCAPSRAGFLSGQYNQRLGVEKNDTRSGLPSDVPIFPEIFRQAGYATALLGKWHPGANQPGLRPMDRGFQEFYGYYTPFLDYRHPKLFRNNKLVTENEYSTDVFARKAEQFIERHKKKPFFLEVAFNAPHITQIRKDYKELASLFKTSPEQFKRSGPGELKAPTARVGEAEKLLGQFDNDWARADTVAAITALDQAVGRILDKLKKTGLDRDTIVFFFSDNGGHPENRSENLPLYEYKWSVYEGGIRIPFFAVYPKAFPAGLTYDQPVMTFDILPTCAALAGVQAPGHLDGVDLTPYLAGKLQTPPHSELCWRMEDLRAIRQGRWKLVMNSDTPPQLFDIQSDYAEQHNVAGEHPEVVSALKKAWATWDAQLPAVPTPTKTESSPSTLFD